MLLSMSWWRDHYPRGITTILGRHFLLHWSCLGFEALNPCLSLLHLSVIQYFPPYSRPYFSPDRYLSKLEAYICVDFRIPQST